MTLGKLLSKLSLHLIHNLYWNVTFVVHFADFKLLSIDLVLYKFAIILWNDVFNVAYYRNTFSLIWYDCQIIIRQGNLALDIFYQQILVPLTIFVLYRKYVLILWIFLFVRVVFNEVIWLVWAFCYSMYILLIFHLLLFNFIMFVSQLFLIESPQRKLTQ